MQENDIINRIISLCNARSWTFYRLSKESGITYSTLCTMLHKSNAPSIPTLIKICSGFGITLSDFFDDGSEHILLSDPQKAHLHRWNTLTPENQAAADKYIDYLLSQQKPEKE
ncbi:MAG: helix-turn-helix transcriptional regulator [Oscillospiraceae bacterium]|nr:helix-turn-helix transcriptional regulator [Oscillospiraceae bacterium]